ncbi:MAG: hypothetical protein LIP11_18285 [Clostridiales bacterium]|nr:hypothetical protein [Clostridiales bacterium]
MTGVTKSGFEYSIPDSARDNMELIDALADLSNGNTLAISDVCLLLLGKETRKSLYEHLRTEDGNVPVAKVENELLEIISSFKEGKNSSSSPA